MTLPVARDKSLAARRQLLDLALKIAFADRHTWAKSGVIAAACLTLEGFESLYLLWGSAYRYTGADGCIIAAFASASASGGRQASGNGDYKNGTQRGKQCKS